METLELSQQQSDLHGELPDHYRAVGVDHRGPLVRKPTGQVSRIRAKRPPDRGPHRGQAQTSRRLDHELLERR
jgi:hypothetical protein